MSENYYCDYCVKKTVVEFLIQIFISMFRCSDI